MASAQQQIVPIDRNKQFKLVSDMLFKAEGRIAACLPTHLTPERMIRVALTAIQTKPKILLCSPTSIIGCVVEASELGLQLNGVLGEAYIVPFWNTGTKRLEAQLQVGYRGLISLARRSGEVSSVSPELVYEWDEFKITLGTDRNILHVPDIDHPDRGLRYPEDVGPDDALEHFKGDLIGLRGAYATVKYKDGSQDFEYCPLNRLDELRSRSKARDRENNEVGPWTTDPGEMYRKVPIRQLAKRLPLSPEFQKAAILDEYGEAGVRQNLGAIIESDPIYSDVVAGLTQQRAEELAAKYATPADTEAANVRTRRR
jgi:recombination protein RecT